MNIITQVDSMTAPETTADGEPAQEQAQRSGRVLPPTPPPSVLQLRGVTKRFGGLTAIRSVTLDVPVNTIASVIGPNGAGKTTLFNCITGFYRPTEGEITFEGRPIHGLKPDEVAKRGIARTYQNIHLFGGMTALENILVGMHTRMESGPVNAILRPPNNRREEDAALARAYALLTFIDLHNVGDVIAHNLPYGSQRRLEIARALASDPRLLLLDEPTAGMNPQETEEIMRFIQRLRDERGLTILLIEHDMHLVMTISEQISVLDYGQKIAEGTPAEIQSNPRVIEAYLGAPSDMGAGRVNKPVVGGPYEGHDQAFGATQQLNAYESDNANGTA